MINPAPNPFMSALLRTVSKVLLRTLTRTTVTGLENIPSTGPLLILANHRSTIDPMLLLANLPAGVAFVGPGDFKLLFPANLIIRWYGLIQVKRSLQLERSSLKLMTDILKSGKMLGLFPEGGTWEKPIWEAKAGAAYLSMTTGVPILPIGLGGTYRAWDRVARLERPRLTINIGKVMPPVRIEDRSKRAEMLDAATRAIMQQIYDLLPDVDRAVYDELEQTHYHLQVNVWRGTDEASSLALPGGDVLAEIMLKPNLMSPLVHNAGLPLDPLMMQGVRFPPASVRLAAVTLQEALHGDFAGYMEYRLGESRSALLYTALDALKNTAEEAGITRISLLPQTKLQPEASQ